MPARGGRDRLPAGASRARAGRGDARAGQDDRDHRLTRVAAAAGRPRPDPRPRRDAQRDAGAAARGSRARAQVLRRREPRDPDAAGGDPHRARGGAARSVAGDTARPSRPPTTRCCAWDGWPRTCWCWPGWRTSEAPVRRRDVDLRPILDSVRAQYADRAAGEGRFVALEAPVTLPVSVDPDRIRQLLVNLLDNAVRRRRGNGHDHRRGRPRRGGAVGLRRGTRLPQRLRRRRVPAVRPSRRRSRTERRRPGALAGRRDRRGPWRPSLARPRWGRGAGQADGPRLAREQGAPARRQSAT